MRAEGKKILVPVPQVQNELVTEEKRRAGGVAPVLQVLRVSLRGIFLTPLFAFSIPALLFSSLVGELVELVELVTNGSGSGFAELPVFLNW